MIRKLIKIKCELLEYVKQILVILATLNNIFDKNSEKSYKFCNVFFKFLSLFTMSHIFVMTTYFKETLELFQCC